MIYVDFLYIKHPVLDIIDPDLHLCMTVREVYSIKIANERFLDINEDNYQFDILDARILRLFFNSGLEKSEFILKNC
jgi:hypothetical protein